MSVSSQNVKIPIAWTDTLIGLGFYAFLVALSFFGTMEIQAHIFMHFLALTYCAVCIWIRNASRLIFNADSVQYGEEDIPYAEIKEIVVIHEPRPFLFRRSFLIFRWGNPESDFALNMYGFSKLNRELIMNILETIVPSSKFHKQ